MIRDPRTEKMLDKGTYKKSAKAETAPSDKIWCIFGDLHMKYNFLVVSLNVVKIEKWILKVFKILEDKSQWGDGEALVQNRGEYQWGGEIGVFAPVVRLWSK